MSVELQFSGTLLEAASARMQPIDGAGHMVPALCMVVELHSATRARCHVEQLFPADHMPQCQAAAHRLKRGAVVTFNAPTVGLELLARNVSHIHRQPETTPKEGPPCS